jgi:hypothetical protein
MPKPEETSIISARVPLDLFAQVEDFVQKTDPDKGGRTRLLITALESYLQSPPRLSSISARVLRAYQTLGEQTDTDIAHVCEIPRTSAAKRRAELVAMGLLKDTGRKAKSRNSDAQITVWGVTGKLYTGGRG